MDEPSYRVSDAERDLTVAALRDHLVAGRLTLEEFSERVESALRAGVGRELAQLQQDLPSVASTGSISNRRPTRFTGALFAHVVRRGRLRLRRRTTVVGAFADIDLDLREATIDHPQTTVNVLVTFANIDVYVPEGINVEVGGIIVFGHHREWGRDLAPPDAPTVRVRAVGCFGTIDIWRVPRDMRGSYGDIFRKIKKQQKKGDGKAKRRDRELPG